MSDRRTTYERAARGFDNEFERALVEAIITAIADVSRVTDANAIVLRTGEMASALLTVLASTLALSPAAARSPTAVRKTLDELNKRLRHRLAAATSDPDFAALYARVFRTDDPERGGSA
jgi:hypothetical protein